MSALPEHWTITVTCIFIMFLFLAIVILGPKYDHEIEARSKCAVIDFGHLAEAIREVENSRFDAIGASGERSEWQIKPGTWKEYSNTPHNLASERAMQTEARQVATVHLHWIAGFLEKQHEHVQPYTIALCWNAGTHRFLLRECTGQQRQFAVRVENAYAELTKENK
jgi:hypothetical protein